MRQLSPTVDQRVARLVRQSQVVHKSRLERSLLLSMNEERQRMKNGVLNKIQTLQIHCYAVWAQEHPHHLLKVNQWHIERIPWQFCDHIPQWHSDILRWPWDALQPHAQGTEKAQWKDFVCEEIKKQVWSKGNWIPWLYYLTWANWEEPKKNGCSQELTSVKMSQESTSLSKVDKLLLKVCT